MTVTDGECDARSERRYRWTDLSVLILSLLLAASVATVVYMAVRPPATTCSDEPVSQIQSQPQKAPTPTTEIDVKVEVDGEKKPQKIAYNEGQNVMIFSDSDGGFSAEDFDKGWVVTNIGSTDDCLVVPTGKGENRTTVSAIMSGYAASGAVQGKSRHNVHAQVLPGLIEDRSLFTDEVNEKCSSYRWLTTVNLDGKDTFKVGERKKRALPGCYCSVLTSYTFTDSFRDQETIYLEICLPWCYNSSCNKRYLCRRYTGTSWYQSSNYVRKGST